MVLVTGGLMLPLPERFGRRARASEILIPLDAVWTISKNLLSGTIPNCRKGSLYHSVN